MTNSVNIQKPFLIRIGPFNRRIEESIPAPVFSPSATVSTQVQDGGRDAPGRLDDFGA
jgi:hypothetical protein